MNNKGQTTILFSLCIGVLFLFTLTALEIGRIHMSKVKILPCVHSMRSSIMADYNEELFERYHLLFLDPTYGTGSEAVLEEKIKDYLETSLNGEGSSLYQFELVDIGLSNKETVLSNDMKLLKKQIADYELTAGIVNRAKELTSKLNSDKESLEEAFNKTERNGVELNLSKDADEEKKQPEEQTTDKKTAKEKDPREVLKKSVKSGVLAYVAPGMTVSKEKLNLKKLPSVKYIEMETQEWNNKFDDIGNLKQLLKTSAEVDEVNLLTQHATFSDYVINHFSNAVKPLDDTVMQCEVEYILKGKDNDYDNLEAVINEMIWLRMPMNYAYLLTDLEKQSQALTLATTICVLTGTEPLAEIVKYLLLGCWAYGESLHEMKLLLAGECIPYVKTNLNWYTDLETLTAVNSVERQTKGFSYEDYLMILLAKKSGDSLNKGYARILDVVELNIQINNPTFQIEDCVGSINIQGKVTMNPFFQKSNNDSVYDYYFDESICYQ